MNVFYNDEKIIQVSLIVFKVTYRHKDLHFLESNGAVFTKKT